MSDWKRYFKVTDRAPSRLVVKARVTVDFKSDRNDEALMLELYESNLPYLEITEAGKEKFYGIKPQKAEGAKKVSSGKRPTEKVIKA